MGKTALGKTTSYWLCIVLLAALATGCSTWSYLVYRVFPDYPEDETGTFSLSGLQAPVRVYLDELGVPHVEADHEVDLVRAVGFLHGRARFFQMDTIRRYARGTLSELFGEQKVVLGSTVELDISMRGWGFGENAEAEADALDPESRQLMTAYMEGVNCALERFEPVEYRLLGVDPEPWTIADSFAAGYLVAWGITHNWQQEFCRLLMALQVGYDRAERILPSEPWPGDPSLTVVGEPRVLPPVVAPELQEMFAERSSAIPGSKARDAVSLMIPLFPAFEGASNGWVLAGGRTRSGMPMVVGDPHLPHMLPSIVFQQHIRCPGLEVIGVTVPGIPYVLIGHNRRVAWTITAAMLDVLDLYIESPDPAAAGHVRGPGGPEPLATETVVVRIREGSKLVEKTARIRRTPRGPLLNDMYPDLLPEGTPLVSVCGIRRGAANTIWSLRQACGAENVGELRRAMMSVVCPICAVSAADTNGDIALFATGTDIVPVREHHRGTFPAPAWLERYRWRTMTQAEEMPHATGRGRDYFVNTNNLMVDPYRSSVMCQIDSAPSYRRDRAVEVIEAVEKHTFESNARLQCDVHLHRAKRLLPPILESLREWNDKTPLEERAEGILSGWDGRAGPESSACAIFFATYREAILTALEDEIGTDVLTYLLSFRYFTNGVDLWFDDPEHPVWDDRSTWTRETRADSLRSAFRRGVRWLERELESEDPRNWRWGDLHMLHPQHAFGSKVNSFSLPASEVGGASASVWKAHFDMSRSEQPFRCLYGPVLRMIVDLGDMDHAMWIIDTGSSGWPLSPHYGDQHELWKCGELARMVSDWEEIERDAAAVLTLRPATVK